jgi:hypothetical protein
MKKTIKNIVISAAVMTGLIAPAIATAAEVPQVPESNATLNSGVTTEPMKVVKVKASKKAPAKKATAKKATAKRAAKKSAAKRTSKKRVRRSIASK